MVIEITVADPDARPTLLELHQLPVVSRPQVSLTTPVHLAHTAKQGRSPMSDEPILIENKPHEEQAEHVHHAPGARGWFGFAAVSAACFAALAALISLLAGHHSDLGMDAQLRAADTWNQYQAKSIKQNLAESKLDILTALGKEAPAHDTANVARYEHEKEDLKKEATALEEESHAHNRVHGRLAIAIGFCQVAIAICAVALLTKRRVFMYIGLVLGLSGVGFFAAALMMSMR
jgi:hypothetical protein